MTIRVTKRKKTKVFDENESNFRTLVEIANEGIIIARPEGNYTFVNDKMAEMLGYPVKEILGKSGTDFMYEKDQKNQVLQARKNLGKNRVLSGEFKFRRKDGSILWTNYNATAIFDSKGRYVANVSLHTDITERKKLEQDLIGLAKFPSENPSAVIRIDKKGLILYANSASQKLPPPLEIKIGQYVPNSWCKHVDKALSSNQSLDFEETTQNRSFLFEVTPIKEEGYVNVYETEITELKKAEERLREAETFAAIGRTAAMIGHDLRNPLQAITGYVGLTEEKLKKMSLRTQEKKELLKDLKELNGLVYYMNKIVSDLQDYSTPVRCLDLKETDVFQLIEQTISTCKIPKTVSTSIKVPKNLTLKLDPSVIRRILTNLINNAVQAMPKGGTLTIRASTQENPDTLVIRIKDTGVGISEENYSKIFEPLFTTKSKGQGLGLPTCKKLVQAHGGSICFRSQLNKGTEFTIELPRVVETNQTRNQK